MFSLPVRTLGRLGALAIVFTGIALGRSEASVLYGQAPDSSLSPGWTTQVFYDPSTSTVGDGYRVYDNFTLSSDAWVTTVTWRGLTWDYIDPAANPAPLKTQSWDLSFWSDALGQPGGAQIGHDLFSAASVQTTLSGTGTYNGSTVNVYDFTATLSSPVFLHANTQYWFSPWSFVSDLDPIFAWAAGVGGDGQSFQTGYGFAAGVATPRPGDRAFSLEGTPADTVVPEPATLGLMAFGLGTLIVGRRRTGQSRGHATMAGQSASWPLDRTPSDRRAPRAGN